MPVLASFDGAAIFGDAVVVTGPDFAPRRTQTNSYPGLNGLEEIEMGDDGMFTTVTGRLLGSSLPDLVSAKTTLMSYFDGNTYTFIDNTGTPWQNVKLVELTWNERGEVLGGGGYSARYTARFKHLTLQ